MIVGRDENRGSLSAHFFQKIHDLFAEARIEVSRRLVRDQNARLMNQGPRDGGPLLLPARERFRILVRFVGESDFFQEIGNPSANVLLFLAENFQRKSHVLKDREVLQQFEILENDADPAAKGGNVRRRNFGEFLIRDDEVSGRHMIKGRYHPEERRFSGAARTGQKDELAFVDSQIDVFERVNRARISLVDMGELDHSQILCPEER